MQVLSVYERTVFLCILCAERGACCYGNQPAPIRISVGFSLPTPAQLPAVPLVSGHLLRMEATASLAPAPVWSQCRPLSRNLEWGPCLADQDYLHVSQMKHSPQTEIYEALTVPALCPSQRKGLFEPQACLVVDHQYAAFASRVQFEEVAVCFFAELMPGFLCLSQICLRRILPPSPKEIKEKPR